MLEIHLAGKTTKKRQNSDTSTPPAHAQHPPTTLNGEARRAPMPPDASSYPAWETTRGDNKQLMVLPGTNQLSPLDRLTPTQGKKKKKH
jgi:hypothetical protein